MEHAKAAGLKRAAVFCLLRCKDSYLLLCRKNPPYQGYYVPVGGKIEAYETPTLAVVREVKEETGISIVNPIFAGTLIETSPINYNWISYIYVADIEYQVPPPCNEGTLHWLMIEEIKKLPIPSTDMYIYQKVIEGKKFSLDALFDKDMTMLSMVDYLA
jgi:8-oxo-dGTP diphosphatase